jgi:glycerol-3-phosphate acyltransferase PlsY
MMDGSTIGLVLVWTTVAYLSGAVPYSLLIGRLAGGVDIRRYGDHNPGAANVLRATGWRWGAVAMLLDGFKGAIPVGAAWFVAGLHGWQIVPVALAPVLGHATSPWLGFRGGKAVAVMFGIWAGMTLGEGPTVLGLLLALMFAVFSPSGWALMLALTAFGFFITRQYGAVYPEFIVIWMGCLALLAWKHLPELRQPLCINIPWRRKV